jgi:hypothetical protein
MVEDPLERVRAICLALPEAVEHKGGVGSPSFTVRAKIFAMRHPDGVHGSRSSLWVKAPRGLQDVLVRSDPKRYFVPPYVGHHGWVGIYLDVALDWDEMAGLIEDSYRMTAPKRLAARINQPGKAPKAPRSPITPRRCPTPVRGLRASMP